jgi:hypothetical protein
MPIEKNATMARTFAMSPGRASNSARSDSGSLGNRLDGVVWGIGERTTAYSQWWNWEH